MQIFKSIGSSYAKFKGTKIGKAFVRTQYRSFCLLALTVLAGAAIEFLVQSARFGGTDLAAKFPEMLQILRALSILTWFEQGLLWIRMAVSPKIDIQELANKLTGTATDNSMSTTGGIIVVYLTNNLMWLVRIVMLYLLCGF